MNESEGEEEDSDEDEDETDQDDWEDNNKANVKINKALTFACIDRTRTVNLWDVSRYVPFKPRASIKLQTDLTQVVFLSKLRMYAACSDERSIKFYNARFELVNTKSTSHAVQFLRYNQNTHELLGAGSHSVSVIFAFNYKLNNHLYDCRNGQQIDRIDSTCKRQICCVLNHYQLGYTILACADGTIKVMNSVFATIHQFVGHSKPVTAMAMYPHGSLFMSCSLDMTVRMYSLKTFKEVYCLQLREPPLGMELIDNTQIYIHVPGTILVWTLNHLNTEFASIGSPIKKLLRAKSRNIPSRVLVRSEDGIIRLLSPVTGKPLSNMMPLLETDGVSDMVYCSKIDRMFLLLDSGEMWVIATNFNPMLVVDIWRTKASDREDISCIALFDGRFGVHDGFSLQHNPKGYVLLFGATRNGQVLVYGRDGGVRDRYQIHSSTITCLLAHEESQILVTAGRDSTIKISVVRPLESQLIQARLVIPTNFVPRMLSVAGDTVCASSDDWTIHMFGFDLLKKRWQKVPNHIKSDDHTEAITAIAPIEKVKLFVTSSMDNTIKVWDSTNTLLRELQFQGPIETLCMASSYGDLLFGIQNRIDIIKFFLYLPPHHVEILRQLHRENSKAEKTAEQPIPFDEQRNNWIQIVRHQKWKTRVGGNDLKSKYTIFEETNWVQNDSSTLSHDNTDVEPLDILQQLKMIQRPAASSEQSAVMKRLAVLIKRRNTAFAADFYQQTEQPKSNDLPDPFEFFKKYENRIMNSVLNLSPYGEEGLPLIEFTSVADLSLEENLEPDSTGTKENAPASVAAAAENEQSNLDPSLHGTDTTAAPSTHGDGTISLNDDEKSPEERGETLLIAPDGEIPNSLLWGQVTSWRAHHRTFSAALDTMGFQATNTHSRKTTTDDNARAHALKEEERKKRSEDYKAKLKSMLENLSSTMSKSVEEEDVKHVVTEETEENDGEEEAKEDEWARLSRLRAMQQGGGAHTRRMRTPDLLQEAKETPLPEVLEKALEYAWFPQEEKIDPTPDALLSIAMNVFKKPTTTREIRAEILHYVRWINEEYGFQDSTEMVHILCQYLQAGVMRDIPPEELQVRFREKILEFLAELHTINQAEFVVTLALQTVLPYESLKTKATNMLRELGLQKPESPFIAEQLTQLFSEFVKHHQVDIFFNYAFGGPDLDEDLETNKKVETETSGMPKMGEEQALAPEDKPHTKTVDEDLRLEIAMWLRKILKTQLIRQAPNREVASKLKKLSVFGLEHHDDEHRKRKVKADAAAKLVSAPTVEGSTKGSSSKQQRVGSPSHENASSKNSRRPSMAVNSRRSSIAVNSRRASIAVKPSSAGKGRRLSKVVKPIMKSQPSRIGGGNDDAIGEDAGDDKEDPLLRMNTLDSLNELGSDEKRVTFQDADTGGKEGETPEQQQQRESASKQYDQRALTPTTFIQTLQKPTAQDLIGALNYYVSANERRIAKQEAARLEKLKRDAEEQERARKKEEERLAHERFLKQKEAERLARQAARLERLRRMREEKEAQRQNRFPRAKRSGKGGVPITHQSPCHPSRETLDVVLRRFPPFASTCLSRAYANDISLHLQRWTKSMPIEKTGHHLACLGAEICLAAVRVGDNTDGIARYTGRQPDNANVDAFQPLWRNSGWSGRRTRCGLSDDEKVFYTGSLYTGSRDSAAAANADEFRQQIAKFSQYVSRFLVVKIFVSIRCAVVQQGVRKRDLREWTGKKLTCWLCYIAKDQGQDLILSIHRTAYGRAEEAMKFGTKLSNALFPEWKYYYVDYDGLKKLLKAGTGPEGKFNDDDETNFLQKVEAELEKVAAFRHIKGEELTRRVQHCETLVSKILASGADEPEAKFSAIEEEINRITVEVNELSKFTRLNYSGFIKIVKKHDKHTSYMLKPMFNVRLGQKPFYKKSIDNLIIRLSKLFDTVRNKGHRLPPTTDAAPGSQNFVRRTTKYWVHPDNVTEVKCIILKYLPVLVFSSKGSREPNPAISSVYFDNDSFELYQGRIEKTEGAEAVRLRWYGTMDQQEIFIERKTHREDWTGESSVKQRFPIKEKYVNDFLKGTYKMDRTIQKMRERGLKSEKELAELQQLSTEVQETVLKKKLHPMVRTFYNRTAFQLPGDARVRISLDTELTMIREDNFDAVRSGDNWRRPDAGIDFPFNYLPSEDVTRFPYAVLEVKLQTQHGTEAPKWVEDLVKSHLVEEVPKFSKFIHGIATMLDSHVSLLPFWLPQMDKDIRKPAPAGYRSQLTGRSPDSYKSPLDDIDVDVKHKLKSTEDLSHLAGPSSSGGSASGADAIEIVVSSERQSRHNRDEGSSRSRISQADERTPLLSGGSHNGDESDIVSEDDALLRRKNRSRKALTWGSSIGGLFKREAMSGGLSIGGSSGGSQQQQKRIALPVRVEPKVFFANERTFLSWLHFCIVLGGLALGLMNFGDKVGQISGLIFTLVAMLFMLYAFFLYQWRAHKIRNRDPGPYDDRFGPTILVICLFFAVMINFWLKFNH
ncbi:vacuolar transporter chaperone [Quaeritorhiza haematococci]|nr:vacuolar transporter chaperone [Quaeritorhiza haematococci]